MGEETGRSLVDFSSLVKVLPIEKIYDDLAARGFKQAGALFEDFMKKIRLALPSVQLSAVDQDRFRKAIEDPYFRVPAEKRILPAAQLVGKVLEGVRYEPEGTPLWQMFEELLQRGCDTERVAEAHPAFGNIIPQLSYDEALLLKEVSVGTKELTIGYQHSFNQFDYLSIEQIGSEFPNLAYRGNALVYANHLEALGLIQDLIGLQREQQGETGKTRLVWQIELSAFGKMFYKAVLRDININ